MSDSGKPGGTYPFAEGPEISGLFHKVVSRQTVPRRLGAFSRTIFGIEESLTELRNKELTPRDLRLLENLENVLGNTRAIVLGIIMENSVTVNSSEGEYDG